MNDQKKSRPEVETLQRVRRIETRVTQMLVGLGFGDGAQRPIFNGGNLLLPSIHCSAKEIIDNIPTDWHGPVGVFVGSQHIMTLDRPGG